MNAPQVNIGDEVRYTPHDCHQLNKNHLGDFLFEFAHEHDALNNAHSYRKGDVVQDHGALGIMQKREGDVIHTMGGHRIRPTCCRRGWKAIVREVFADGTVALDVQHPRGGITYHYPSHGATAGLRYSKEREPHTWHLVEDEDCKGK